MLQSRKIRQPGIKYLNSDHVRTSARTHERTTIFRELSEKYIPTRYQTSHSGHARTCARKHARTITLRELSGYFPRFFRRTQAAERLTLQQHRQQAHAEAGIRVKKAGEPKTDIKEKKNTHTHDSTDGKPTAQCFLPLAGTTKCSSSRRRGKRRYHEQSPRNDGIYSAGPA